MSMLNASGAVDAPLNDRTQTAHQLVEVPPMDEFNRKLVANAHPPL